jgi:hypothetical protein
MLEQSERVSEVTFISHTADSADPRIRIRRGCRAVMWFAQILDSELVVSSGGVAHWIIGMGSGAASGLDWYSVQERG